MVNTLPPSQMLAALTDDSQRPVTPLDAERLGVGACGLGDCSPPQALRTITALLVLRDQVIKPILAGVRVPRRGRKPKTWTRTDQHNEALRLEMQAPLNDCGITA